MVGFRLRIINRAGTVSDCGGLDLGDVDSARQEAVWRARDIVAAQQTDSGFVDLSGAVEVIDANGQPVLTVPIREAAGVKG